MVESSSDRSKSPMSDEEYNKIELTPLQREINKENKQVSTNAFDRT
jgi:hypothetical protein